MSENEGEPTLQLPDQNEDRTRTLPGNNPVTDPSRVVSDASRARPETRDEHFDLEPNRSRFFVVCGLHVLMAGWLVLNIVNILSVQSSVDFGWSNDKQTIIFAGDDGPMAPRLGDRILSINSTPVDAKYKVRQIVRKLKTGEPYVLAVERDGETLQLLRTAQPLPRESIFISVYLGVLQPLVFLISGFVLFLFKPNNKLVLVCAIAFALTAASTSPLHFITYAEASTFIVFIWQVGYFLSLLGAPVLLQFVLLFPKPSFIVRRYPKVQFWIYVPFLFYVLPTEIAQQLSWNGLTSFDIFYDNQLLFLGDYLYSPYLLATLLVLIFSYRESDDLGRRRMRVLIAGVTLAVVPFLVTDFVLPLFEQFLGFRVLPSAMWSDFVGNSFVTFAPPIFGYAVIKHRVIPVSFIIRRGLQYIFAKNGLRLLVLLPLGGIIFNIVSDPDRTLSEIILNNSITFYTLAALAAAFGLLSRYRFNDWIDRRFFREQYDQELLLRGLIENVKDSDSMLKLSRLVSSQIQAAMHPSCLHFFYEEKQTSQFSVGYTTAENSGQLRLAADSPLLTFMQKTHETVDYPSREADELPTREKDWLIEIGANLLVPMHGTDGKLAGFFSLGPKLSEIGYTKRDRELLQTLANQIAIVHENLSLKERMRRDQRIRDEVLSRFDEGNINLLKECPRCGRCFDRTAEKCDADNFELTFSLPVERTIESRYRLERLIGKGGMGAVYEATDLRINRRVAVKILSGAKFGNREALRRFEREAQTAGKLNHPNIVTVFDYGVLSTQGAFLVMEFVTGEALAGILRRGPTLNAATVIDWFGQVLDGIEAAHKSGIVHRDLKPDNILVTHRDDGTVRICILDFGLARFNESQLDESVTTPGTVMGTLGYMAPEQLRGERADERTDLFAVCVMIYECLQGERPFAGRTYMEIMQSMSKTMGFGNSGRFSSFFDRGLAQVPMMRFGSADEMKSELAKQSL